MKRISLLKLVVLLAAFIGVFTFIGVTHGPAVAALIFVGLSLMLAPKQGPTFGAECMNLDTINNFFATAKNQFTPPIYNWIWRTNPWVGVVPRSMYDYQDGLIPEVNTSTAELPTDYPDDLSNITLSNGTGNTACVIDPRVILDGYINRNFRLENDAWKSRVFCLTDLQFSWQAEAMATNLQKLMQNYTTVRWSDWYRIKNICMLDNKVSTGSGSTFDSDANSECNFTGVDVPTAELSWDHLNCIYDELVALGAEPVGYSEGQPLFPLSTGPGYKRKLWQTDNQVRDTVNWGDAFQNFTARGINTSINGYIPNVDEFPIRYAADGTTKIYPTINSAASVGRKFISNPDYKTVARGGLAVYEVFTILPKNVYEVKVRPTGPTSFGSMTFDPQNYVGDAQWINHPDMNCNPLGNLGYFLMQLSMAAKPVRPEVGYAGLTLAKDC